MNYKVLVTLDLPDADSAQRSKFYESLSANKWNKTDSLTTAWNLKFWEGATAADVDRVIKEHLDTASHASGVRKVDYGYQLGYAEVTVDKVRR